MTFKQQISEDIWNQKYRFKKHDGEIIDQTVEDTWKRIAKQLASSEKVQFRNFWEKKFYDALNGFKFIPAGRIISGAGTGRRVTLSNCFTMGTIPDSMSGIFDHLKEAALTMQQGGGIGYDFSTIRPQGCHVKGVDSDASGPLTFMDVWDAMCRTVMSAGSRRGAMMATMRCDHPDVEKFIEAKRDSNRLRMFNVSVLITDDFMQAVKNNSDWDLVWDGEVHKTINANVLWDKIMMSTYNYAEPGVIFIDRVNEMHNINYLETIATTNPCGEKPMGPYASCLLGSVNLTTFVKNPFTEECEFDYDNLREIVKVAVRMMDNVIESSNFPLEKQKKKAIDDRQLGLGVTGLADAITMMTETYGSKEAVELTESIMAVILNESYTMSAKIASEKGTFKTYSKSKFMESNFVKSGYLDQSTLDTMDRCGMRNALVVSIAPTGTISMYANNVSSGIEPIFATSFDRKILNPDGSHRIDSVTDYAVKVYKEIYPDNDLPDYFVTAQTITPEDHIVMQAAVQKYVDSSISKTTNCPEDISFEDFKNVYMLAYDMGCKGCTTYRPNDVTGSILTATEDNKSDEGGGACTYDPETGTRTCDE